MNVAELTQAASAPSSLSIGRDRGEISSVHGSFAAAMAAVDTGRLAPLLRVAAQPPSGFVDPSSALGLLARRLDEVGRHRVEAQALSDALAGTWASGIDAPALAVLMHQQARAMASYNISVMWGAKLVGVTAGALRQLVAAT